MTAVSSCIVLCFTDGFLVSLCRLSSVVTLWQKMFSLSHRNKSFYFLKLTHTNWEIWPCVFPCPSSFFPPLLFFSLIFFSFLCFFFFYLTRPLSVKVFISFCLILAFFPSCVSFLFSFLPLSRSVLEKAVTLPASAAERITLSLFLTHTRAHTHTHWHSVNPPNPHTHTHS